MALYAGLFVSADFAYNLFEHLVLSRADARRLATAMRRKARKRSALVLAGFVTSALVSLRAPRLGFGLICAALIPHLEPDVAPSQVDGDVANRS